MLRIAAVLVLIGVFEYQTCHGDSTADDWRRQGFYRPRRNYPSQNQDNNSFPARSSQNYQTQSAFSSEFTKSSVGSGYSQPHSFGSGSQTSKDTSRLSFGQSQNENVFESSNQNPQNQASFGINNENKGTGYSQNTASQNNVGSGSLSTFAGSFSQNPQRSNNGQSSFGSSFSQSSSQSFGSYSQNTQGQNSFERTYNYKSQNPVRDFGQNVQTQNAFGNFQSQNPFTYSASNSAFANGQVYQGPDYLPPKRFMAPEYLPPDEPRTTSTRRPFYTTTTTKRPFYTTTTTRRPFFTTTTTRRPFYTTTTTRRPFYTTTTTRRPFYTTTTTRRPFYTTTTTRRPIFTTTTMRPTKPSAHPAPAMATPVPPEEEYDDENNPENMKLPDVAPALGMEVPPEPEDGGDEILLEFATTTKKNVPSPSTTISNTPPTTTSTTPPTTTSTTPPTTTSTTPPTTTSTTPPTTTSTTPPTTTSTTPLTTISTTPPTTTSTTPPTTTSTTPPATTSTTPPTTTSTTPSTTTSTTPPTTTSTTPPITTSTAPPTTTSTAPPTTTSTTPPITTSTTPPTTTTPSTTTTTTPSTTTMTTTPSTTTFIPTTTPLTSTTSSLPTTTTPDPNRNLIEEESIPTTPPTTTFKAPEYLPPVNTTKKPDSLPAVPAAAEAFPVLPEPECDPLDPSTYPSEIDQRYFGDTPCAPTTTTVKPPYRGPLYLPPPPDTDLCVPKTRVRRSSEPTLRLGDLKGTPRPVWYAGVYKKVTDPYYPICGGSIVREDIIISAAHCFWDDEGGKQPADLFAVASSKIYKPWKDPMDKKAQKSDVLDITIPPRYLGTKASFQEDIAILKLATPFKFTRGVRPICVDFDVGSDREQMRSGHYGTIAGWGYTDSKGTPTQRLLWLELPYIEIEKCIRDSEESFLKYITSDKVCAGENNTGKALCRGDSGGGLAFWRGPADHATPYLRGIASTAPTDKNAACNVFAYASFTHIYAHRTFLRDHLPDIEQCRFW